MIHSWFRFDTDFRPDDMEISMIYLFTLPKCQIRMVDSGLDCIGAVYKSIVIFVT